MKPLTILLFPLLLTVSVYAQSQKYRIPVIATADNFDKKVYIDPTVPDGGNGTKEKPYNSWKDVQIKSNTAYLFKSGTIFEGEISGVFTNNYIGNYGKGTPPVIRRLGVSSGTDGLTVNRIHIIREGFVWQMVALSETDNGPKNVTIANCLIKGIDNGEGYPHRNIQGKCDGLVLYHNEICYSDNDGIYLASYAPNATIVSNYIHHNNLGGVTATNSAGDGVQLENAHCSNLYIANNYIDRKESNWKFCLIVNSLLNLQSNVTCEWNTFVSPKKSSAGGTSVRWLGGTKNIYSKNLIDSWAGLPGIDTYNKHANQPEPYGIRDNIEYGPNIHCALCSSGDNLDFKTKEEYLAYIEKNNLEEYGSDLFIENFWGDENSNQTNPCGSTFISVNPSLVNDTNKLGIGYIETNIAGTNGDFTCKWSNGKTSNSIYNLTSGTYTITVTDSEYCSKTESYSIKNINKHEEIAVKGKKLTVSSSTAENSDGNAVENMLDKNLDTRWSSNVNEVTATFTLDSVYNVEYIKIATYKGDERNTMLEIYSSEDGEKWELVQEITTSGITNELETYELESSNAKYIKIVGLGNNARGSEKWTSITEIEVWGETATDKNTPKIEKEPGKNETENEEIDSVLTTQITTESLPSLQIRPNPVNNYFSVKIDKQAFLKIISPEGICIMEQTINAGITSIEYHFTKKGTYIVTATYMDGKIESQEIIAQ